jgi:hypothetical protein
MQCVELIGGIRTVFHQHLCVLSASVWRTQVFINSSSFEMDFEDEFILLVLLQKTLQK